MASRGHSAEMGTSGNRAARVGSYLSTLARADSSLGGRGMALVLGNSVGRENLQGCGTVSLRVCCSVGSVSIAGFAV